MSHRPVECAVGAFRPGGSSSVPLFDVVDAEAGARAPGASVGELGMTKIRHKMSHPAYEPLVLTVKVG